MKIRRRFVATNKKPIQVKNDCVKVGETLETYDKYLPHEKLVENKRRPVITLEVNSKGELIVLPASTQNNKHTTEYKRYGIKFYRHNIEVVDDENKAIKLNDKFRRTDKTRIIPKEDVEKIKNKVIHHTKFSSENRKKYAEYKNRHKKSRD